MKIFNTCTKHILKFGLYVELYVFTIHNHMNFNLLHINQFLRYM